MLKGLIKVGYIPATRPSERDCIAIFGLDTDTPRFYGSARALYVEDFQRNANYRPATEDDWQAAVARCNLPDGVRP